MSEAINIVIAPPSKNKKLVITVRRERELPRDFRKEKEDLRKALKGRGGKKVAPPSWATVLLLAEKWGIPPWQVEEEVSEYWYNNAVAYYDILARQSDKKSSGSASSVKGHEGMTAGKKIGGDVDPEAGGKLIWPD